MITLADPIAHARRCFGDRIAVIVSANGHRYFEAFSACLPLASCLCR